MPDPVVNPQPNAAPSQEDQIASLAEALQKLQPYLQTNTPPAGDPAPAQNQPPAPVAQPDPAAAQPLTVTLPNGQVISAATPQELSRQIEAFMYHAERDRQALALRGQHAAAEPQPQVEPWKAPTMAEKEAYAQKFLENPYEATVHALKAITGWDDPVAVLKQTVQGVQEQQEAMAVNQFLLRNQDYVPSQQNLGVINQIMQQAGWQSSVVNLEAAWEMAKKAGIAVTKDKLQAAQAAQPPAQNAPAAHPQFQQPGQQFPFQQAIATPPNAPPAVPRGTNGNAADLDVMAQFENLSADQMREVLIRMGYGK